MKQQEQKGKSARDCADEMMKKGGDSAKAIRYAIGYGAGLEKRRPGTADKFMSKNKSNKR
jgi:hypothetical protein